MAFNDFPEAWNQDFKANMDTNLNPELKKFLDNKILSSEEAKILTATFEANAGAILNVSIDNLKLLREVIWTTSKTAWHITYDEKRIIADIAEQWISNEWIEDELDSHGQLWFEAPLYSVWIEQEDDDQYIQSVRAKEDDQILAEYDADFEEMSHQDFNDFLQQHTNTPEQAIQRLWIESLEQIYTRPWLVASLQSIIWTTPDWLWWKNSKKAFNRFVANTEGIDSLEDIILQYNLADIENKYRDISYDSPLGSEENYREQYGDFMAAMESNLGFPSWGWIAIVRKESTFWQTEENLNSGSGSKGLMMLTKWPFEDMRWLWWSRVDVKKIQKFQAIFKRMDIPSLMKVGSAYGNPIESTLPAYIWNDLQEFATTNDTTKAAQIMTEFQILIKLADNKDKYTHTLNQIIWMGFAGYHYENQWGEDVNELSYSEISLENREAFRLAAREYNSDTTKVKWKQSGDMIEVRDAYSRRVMLYLRNEHGIDLGKK